MNKIKFFADGSCLVLCVFISVVVVGFTCVVEFSMFAAWSPEIRSFSFFFVYFFYIIFFPLQMVVRGAILFMSKFHHTKTCWIRFFFLFSCCLDTCNWMCVCICTSFVSISASTITSFDFKIIISIQNVFNINKCLSTLEFPSSAKR